jgi:type I restriction enzyme S subunit
MVVRARLSAPRQERDNWPWHHAKWTTLSSSLLMGGDRRMEAENYLAGGYGIRLALEARKAGWVRMEKLAQVWQPSRLKGIQVSREYGTPFLAATQVFDLRPVPRKFLSLDRTDSATERFVTSGMILLTCSGSVGRATLASTSHEGILISHDLLRIEPKQEKLWGWLYAYLRAPQTRAMMSAAQYGHVIKHLEVSHLNALPLPVLRDELLGEFNMRVQALLDKRTLAVELQNEAEQLFSDAIGQIRPAENPEIGFTVRASEIFGQRRRLEGGFWTPSATAIVQRFNALGLKIEPLSEVTERVWWMTRFKRVFGNDGDVPYMSADELFSLNAPITKRVVIEQADNADDYFVKAGWIVMACSGQIYGLNGSVALMTKKHEHAFYSHDLVRIIPKLNSIRPGYLFTVLGHPQLGRPLVIRHAYGTSIPHLDPTDVAKIPIVRFTPEQENEIADKMEMSVNLRAEADELENEIAADAEVIIDRFIAGDMQDVVMAP